MVVIAKPPDVIVPSERTPGQFAGPGIEGGVGQAGVNLGRNVRALARPLIGWAEQIAQVQDAGDEARFLGIVNTEREAMRAYMEANPSLYPEFEAKWGESELRIKKAAESVMRRRTQDRLQDYIGKNNPIWKATVTKNIQDGTVLQTKVDALDTIDKTIVGDFRDDARAASNIEDGVIIEERELKLARIKELIDNANVNGMLWNPLEVRNLMNDAEKAIDIYEDVRKATRAEDAIENIKPALIAAISVSNKSEDGYEVLNEATAQLVKDDILTEPEAAETNKKLGDWIDSYVSGRIKAAKEADKLTTIQSYRELSKPILNGKLTYDDIDNSGLRETRRSGEQISDADKWRKYIKGSYKDAPTKSSPEGHTVSFAAIYDAATLQLSPKEAYDVLLESRFVDESITNGQFEWAVDKIENPYSRHTLEDLNATLKSNLEDFNRLFSADKERNKKVNEALISWVDAQDKPPSKKEMFAMSSAFRAGGGQPYDIGRIIERGGREWEIIGFDENGEPLVEEIP